MCFAVSAVVKRWLRFVIVAGGVLLGLDLANSSLSARELPGLGGSAMLVVTAMTEPAALLVWGSALAALSHLVGRKRQKN